MAAGTFLIYTRNIDLINIGDLLSATVKLALVTSSYTPDYDETTGHYLWSSASGNEIANGNGYTTGGATLANKAKTAIVNGFMFDSDDVVWTASGGSIPAWRTGVMYVSGSLWGLTNPLIGSFLGDNAPADIAATTAGNNLTVTAPSAGWFDKS